MYNDIERLKLIQRKISEAMREYQLLIQPIINNLATILMHTEFSIKMYEDGRIERVDKPTEEQQEAIELCNELIDLHRGNLSKRLRK